MAYNPKYYIGTDLWELSPKRPAIHTFVLSDGTLVGMFQGKKGANPQLDFKVKILLDGSNEKPELPPHVYWVTDVLLKGQTFPQEINDIIDYYIDFYDKKCTPFSSLNARASYSPQTVRHICQTYSHVKVPRTLPIDYIALMIELFCFCEKQNPGAYQFRNSLQRIKDFLNGTATYMDVLRLVVSHR